MIFKFGDFQFDCKQQTLTKHGNIINLHEKPAMLLQYLLENTDKISSKNEILENVWPDRVVTEQVIFQNISYLRAKFGDNAIKTFAKKGYQWQLPLTTVAHELAAPPSDEALIASIPLSSPSRGKTTNNILLKSRLPLKVYIAVGVVVLMFVVLSWLYTGNNTLDSTHQQGLNSVHLLESSAKSIRDHNALKTITPQAVFDSPFSSWRQYATKNTQWLVAYRLYNVQNTVVLRFHLQGANRGWQDYIQAKTAIEAKKQLGELIDLLSSSNYFAVSLHHAARAELTVLANNNTRNTLINTQLIQLSYQLNDLDLANVLVDQLLDQNPTELRYGLLSLMKARINLWDRNDRLAEESINNALPIFQKLKLTHLKSQALIELAWVHLSKQEFRQGVQVLNQAASKARTAKEPLLEVTAHFNQAFMASKSGQVELSFAQLGFAKELISLHQLAEEHQVQLFNNLSWMAGTLDDKVIHNQKILDMPFSPQYEIYFYVAAEIVRDYYIHRHKWQNAYATIKPWQRESFQSLSKANIAFGRNDREQGVVYAISAFQQAQLHHHKVDALNAALLLIKHQTADQVSIDENKYTNFIRQNATNRWREQNDADLQQINESINK